MHLDHYQAEAKTTAQYPKQAAILYPLLGLAGEVGELVAKLRDQYFPHGSVNCTTPVLQSIYDTLTRVSSVAIGAETLKKQIREQNIIDEKTGAYLEARASVIRRENVKLPILKEQGDTLWYEAMLATDLHENLGNVASINLDKLRKRKVSNLIKGSGDDRENDLPTLDR